MSAGLIPAAVAESLGLVPDLVVAATSTGTITWMSPDVPPEFGWEPADLIGTSMLDLFAKEENLILHLGALAEVLEGPGVYGPFEVAVVAADGSRREMELMVRNALDDPGVGLLVGSARDVTGRATGVGVGRREAWASALLKGTPNLVLVTDRAGDIIYVGPSSTRILQREPSEMIGTNLLDLVHPDDLVTTPDTRSRVDLALGVGPARSPVVRLRTGLQAWLPMVMERGFASDLGEDAVVLSGRPVDEVSALGGLLEEQARLLERIARGEGLDDTLLALDRLAGDRLPGGDLLVAYVDLSGQVVQVGPRVDPRTAETLTSHVLTRPGVQVDRERWLSVLASPDASRYRGLQVADLEAGQGGVVGYVALLSDEERALSSEEADIFRLVVDLASLAVDRNDLHARLSRAALRDDLTQLPNRRELLARMRELFDQPDATGGLLFIDIDRFKLVNDSMGHEAGDLLLREVTNRFLTVVRPEDLVARVGGDEFVVLCPNMVDVAEVTAVAHGIQTALSEPVVLEGNRVVVAASIGVRHVAGVVDPTELLRDADLAMYEAKRRGRNRVEIFQVGLREQAVTRLATETALREAVQLDQMELHHQPIVRLEDGQIVGVEALLRWERPGVGPVPPQEVIPMLIDTGLILPLGRWVIAEAVRTVARWPELTIGVNLAARQLADVDLVDHIAEVLARYDVAPERLCLEVTEAELITDADQVAEMLLGFKALGVRLAIDDFGTGFATLDYLRRFAVADLLKIDGSFVAGVANPESNDLAIISAAIGLATDLGFTCVAEGVETDQQRSILRALGCELAQGYLFSPAVPADDIDRLMADPVTLLPRAR